jgi:hypothetical protein
MLSHFDIKFRRESDWDALHELGLTFQDIEQLFYGEYHVVHFSDHHPFVIGYTNFRMLLVDFAFDFSNGLIIIEEINYARADEIEEKYCKPRCR